MAKPIIEAHIAHHKNIVSVLTEKARIEIGGPGVQEITKSSPVASWAYFVSIAAAASRGGTKAFNARTTTGRRRDLRMSLFFSAGVVGASRERRRR